MQDKELTPRQCYWLEHVRAWKAPDGQNGKFSVECLSEHWFHSLSHARAIIWAWKRGYNKADHTLRWDIEFRPKWPKS